MNSTMASNSHKLVFPFIFLSFLNFAITTVALDFDILAHKCSTNITSADSAFLVNLGSLSSNLYSNAAANPQFYNTQFYNTTVTATKPSDTIYGLFMCRGDLPSCTQCVGNATHKLSLDPECPLSKESVIWYDECMVRYSNTSFFSTVATDPLAYMWNTANVSNQGSFMKLFLDTMNKTADEAAKPGPVLAKKYATKEANISVSQTLYCLAQCTPDLSPQDCRSCLDEAIGQLSMCCGGKRGARVLFPSCNIRYELYHFYNSPAPAAAQAPPPITNSSTLATTPTTNSSNSGENGGTSMGIIVAIVVAVLLFIVGICLLRKRASKRIGRIKALKRYRATLKENFGNESSTLESLQFDLATIEAATNKFSNENMIGKGGFGEVYKGTLSDGREVAVKRLSKRSMQGVVEFKNEVLLIAKLQHRNLVALFGFCLQEEEKILVYEFVPNKSLDYFLFDPKKQRLLSWCERYKIIGGIARAILYLHEYSRLKIIHRDIKPSNILLDDKMIPKISDFGMARMVAIDHEQGLTNRIVGTYGYMSPEYAMLGKFSEKSDIFSFGVVVLEIISGKRNSTSYQPYYFDGLSSYAWKQWRDGKPFEILDPSLRESCSPMEVTKSIQIGLLCVQENPDDRPLMAEVVSYLSNPSIKLPFPREPAFFIHDGMEPNMSAVELQLSHVIDNSIPYSINEMSASGSFPR